MSSTSEVGHAKNVANLQKLIEQVTVYTKYNPSVDALTIPKLQTLYDDALVEITNTANTKNANKDAIYARQVAFKDLKSKSTQIINQLDILNLAPGKMEQAKSLNREIQGSSLKKETNPTPPEPEKKENSTSRQSFTQQAENFSTLVQILAEIPTYKPNEEQLQVATLTIYKEDLMSTTKTVDQTEAALNKQLTTRNEKLYSEDTGLYDIAQDVKKYVKSVYGATSPEYKNVSAIKFTDNKS